jgi:hypothetical protein
MLRKEKSMTRYQIELSGHLDASWGDWFEAVTLIHLPDGSTCLTIELPDQSALLGLLLRFHGLGLELVSLSCIQGISPLVSNP